jgi:SAM-dependent methyltransferase
MIEATYHARDEGTGPENDERYVAPAIGAPLAADPMGAAALRPGERVLDVACGPGVATMLAARAVGDGGRVAGLDVDPTDEQRTALPADVLARWQPFVLDGALGSALGLTTARAS